MACTHADQRTAQGVPAPAAEQTDPYQPEGAAEVARVRLAHLYAGGDPRGGAPEADGAALPWEFVGPVGAQGPAGCLPVAGTWTGRIISFAQDFGNPSLLWAGASSGGLWRSTDEGASWAPAFDAIAHPSISAIETHLVRSGTAWVGTGSFGTGFGGTGAPSMGLLYTTSDGGLSWSRVAFTSLITAYVSDIDVQPGGDPNSDVVFVASSQGLFRGEAGTWDRVVVDQMAAVEVVGQPLTGSFSVVATTRNGVVHVSGSQGTAGSFVTKALPGAPPALARIALGAGRIGVHNAVYASVAAPDDTWAGIWRSMDRGQSWTQVTTPVPAAGQMRHNNAIAVSDSNPNVVWTGCNARAMYTSTDAGVTWTASANLTHEDVQCIWPHVTKRNVVFAGNDGGLVRSEDVGTTWRTVGGTSLAAMQVRTLAVNPDQANKFAGTRYAIGTQDNGVQMGPNEFRQWDAITCCDGGDVLFKDGTLYSTLVGLSSTSQFRFQYPPSLSQTCGAWNSFSSGLPSGQPWTADLTWSGRSFLTNFGGAVYSTPGPGTAWSQRFSVPAGTVPTKVAATLATPTAEVIVVGLDGSIVPMRVSTPANPTLHLATLRSGSWSGKQVTDIEFGSVSDAGRLVIAGLSGITRTRVVCSRDSGETWNDCTGNLGSMINVRCVLWSPDDRGHLYIGSDLGVFVSTDRGTTWQSYNDGLPTTPYVTDMVYDPRSNEIAIGTYGRGVFTRAPL